MNVGIIENNVIINIVVCESLDSAKSFFPNNDVINVSDSTLGINHFFDNGVWYPPKPASDFVWNAELSKWEKPL